MLLVSSQNVNVTRYFLQCSPIFQVFLASPVLEVWSLQFVAWQPQYHNTTQNQCFAEYFSVHLCSLKMLLTIVISPTVFLCVCQLVHRRVFRSLFTGECWVFSQFVAPASGSRQPAPGLVNLLPRPVAPTTTTTGPARTRGRTHF